MKRFQSSLAILCVAGVFGCSDTATEPSPEANVNATAKTEPAREAVALTNEIPAGATEKSESTSAPAETKEPAATDVPGEIAKQETTIPTPDPKPERDPILEGLKFQGLDEQFAEIQAAYKSSPKDPVAVEQYLGIVEQLGLIHASQSHTATANAAFKRAGEILEQAIEAGIELDERMKGVVFYNYACVKSNDGKADDALLLIEKAIENGYSDLNQLQTDEDLVAVRDLPGFAEKFADWELKAKERQLEHARADLAGAESFPFTFELTNVDGAPIKLADFQGKVCIVDIWGTWCPPCRAEIPSFIKLQETYGSQGFQMVGLNQERGSTPDEQVEKVVSYIKDNGMNYPCAMITEDVMGQVPDFQGFPTTLFIDRQGKVRLKAVGLHEYAYLEAIVSELLAEESVTAPVEGAAAPASDAPASPVGDAAQESP